MNTKSTLLSYHTFNSWESHGDMAIWFGRDKNVHFAFFVELSVLGHGKIQSFLAVLVAGNDYGIWSPVTC